MMDIRDFDEGQFYNDDIFSGEHKSVLFTVNKVIIIHAAREAELSQEEGKDKAEVAFSVDGEDEVLVFFTGSEWLRKVLFNEKTTFPFRCIIKIVRMGNLLSFRFTNPSTEITKEDIENMELFRLKQGRNFVNRM